MKRFFSLLLLAAVLSAVPAYARTFVLSAGISDYQDPRVNDLKTPGRDAIAFSNVMKTQTKDVMTLTSSHATRDKILSALQAICNRAESGDRIVFFFSGHGGDGGYVLAYDKPLYYRELSQAINSTKAQEVICVIDACFAGSVAEDLKATDKNLVFFLSCRPDEVSQEARWVGAGYLTQALLKGMQGKADTNGDRRISVMELFKYAYGDVLARIEQANQRMPEDMKPWSQHPQLIAAPQSYDIILTEWK